MTATYNTTSPSSRDKLRLKISDTNTSRPIFEDAELDMVLGEQSDVKLAARDCFIIMAGSAAKQAVMLSLPGVTISRQNLSAALLALADKVEASAYGDADGDSSNWYTDDASYYDAITGRAQVDFNTPDTE